MQTFESTLKWNVKKQVKWMSIFRFSPISPVLEPRSSCQTVSEQILLWLLTTKMVSGISPWSCRGSKRINLFSCDFCPSPSATGGGNRWTLFKQPPSFWKKWDQTWRQNLKLGLTKALRVGMKKCGFRQGSTEFSLELSIVKAAA